MHAHTHTHTTTSNYSISSQLSDYKREGLVEEGGQSGARQQAKTIHLHICTESLRSLLNYQQRKNRGDGQAGQNEVKLILFMKGDRYSHSVCMCERCVCFSEHVNQ